MWSDWQDLSAKERRIKDVPETVAFSEYEDHPRGRVVFHSASKTFIIYADRRLQREETVSRLVEVFGIALCAYEVRSDSHYV